MEKPPFLSDLTLQDWLLAAAFVVVLALLVQNLLPPYGWAVGIVIALVLLFMAKRKRDRLKNPPNPDQ